ncbi:MAG: helix-turn-helix domain-containing protein [Tolypothrix sp. Co-bin9]|nr:helix-turn-helix domain-containing protein [Tolypothrix sp. Co-bin9]
MTLFNEPQQEQLKEIGAYLGQVRQEKSIRIEEIAAKTLIRQTFLEALEEGRFEDLPEPIYVQGFIRRYGDILELDGTSLARSFAINFFLFDSANDSSNVEKKPSLYIPLAVPYILLLAAASFGLFYILNPRRPTQPVTQKEKSSIVAKPKTAPILSSVQPRTLPSPKVASTPTLTASPNADTNSTVEVTLELQDTSWLQVKEDGKTTFEGNLEKGERKTWTAKKQLTIRSGNAGAVLVTANKKEPQILGNLGAIKEVTFTPEVNNEESKLNNQ